MCVCVCVCVRERESVRVCVFVCVKSSLYYFLISHWSQTRQDWNDFVSSGPSMACLQLAINILMHSCSVTSQVRTTDLLHFIEDVFAQHWSDRCAHAHHSRDLGASTTSSAPENLNHFSQSVRFNEPIHNRVITKAFLSFRVQFYFHLCHKIVFCSLLGYIAAPNVNKLLLLL